MGGGLVFGLNGFGGQCFFLVSVVVSLCLRSYFGWGRYVELDIGICSWDLRFELLLGIFWEVCFCCWVVIYFQENLVWFKKCFIVQKEICCLGIDIIGRLIKLRMRSKGRK